MKTKQALVLIITLLFSFGLKATTWDEPWQDEILKKAESFVLAEVVSSDEEKGVTIEITKCLGGKKLKGKITISDFYMLDLCSMSGGHGPEFHFAHVTECYFLISKNKKGKYCLPTPTSGFDRVKDGKVYATYRHSYHQCLVPVDIYEKTMTAVFNSYHKEDYDKKYMTEFISKQLAQKPMGFGEDEINTFFTQHVAMECAYHLKLTGYYNQLLPFLNDSANFHNQISAARALRVYNTTECKQQLLNLVTDTTKSDFAKVICITTLTELKPTELKSTIEKLKADASEKDVSFGGNIMDPRVCTRLPNVKKAIEELLGKL